jgi:hypothetical protein
MNVAPISPMSVFCNDGQLSVVTILPKYGLRCNVLIVTK